MKFIVDYAILRTALQLCAGVTEKKASSVVPSLMNVRLWAEGDSLTLSATDLEVTAIYTIPAIIASGGGCTVEAAALLDIAKSAPDALTIVLDESNMRLTVTTGRASYTLPGMPIDSYPTLPDMSESGGVLEFSASEFLPMLRTVAYAIPSENQKGMSLCGAYVNVQKTVVDVCATGGYQLALMSLPGRFGQELSLLLPAKLVRSSERLSVSADATTVHLEWTDNHAAITLGPVSIIGRREDVRYPNYGAMVPDYQSDVSFLANTETLKSTLGRVSPFTREQTSAVRLSLTRGNLTIESARNGERGVATDSADVDYAGKDAVTGVNASYLSDALAVVATSLVSVDFGADPLTSLMVVRPAESSLPFAATHIIAKMDLSKWEPR